MYLHNAGSGLGSVQAFKGIPDFTRCGIANNLRDKTLGDGRHKSAEDHLVLLEPCEIGWVGYGGRGIFRGSGAGDCLWWWKDSAFNKIECILAFEVGDHLPLPGEIIVMCKLSYDIVREVIQKGGWRDREGGGWGYSKRGIGGIGRRGRGGHNRSRLSRITKKKMRLEP